MKKPPQPLKGLALQQQLLTKAIKPTTNPLQQQKNQTRFNTLNKLNTVATTPGYTGTASPGYTGTQPGVSAPQTPVGTTTPVVTTPTATTGTTPYYYGASGSGKGKTVKDPTTGKTYSADSVRGQELATQYGYTDAPVEPGTEDVATYAEIGAANIQAEYDANLDTELDLFGEQKGYSSMDEYIQDQKKAQDEQAELQRQQLELQKTQIGEQTSAQRNAQENQVTAASALIGSQEGVTSQSNLSAYDTAKNAASVQISRLQRDQDMSIKAIEQAKTDLARAERAGNTELAKQYRSTLLAAESAAQATETAYVNALTMASEEERNVQAQNNANLQAFTEMVDTGNEMTVESISGFANRLGIDFDTAYGYYAGAQAIRDDKTLTNEEKVIANAQNLQNLNDQISGMDIEAVKKADIYNQMVASGDYTEEQLQVMSSMLGVADKYNKSYQAQLAYDTASAAIKQYEAKYLGQPPPSGSSERLDYDIKKAELAKAQYDLDQATGTGTTIDNSTAESVFFQDGASDYASQSGWSQDSNLRQCGEGYNDITDGSKAGDTYLQKMGMVTKRDGPMIGNGLVLPLVNKGETEPTNGHIETVISVSASGGIQTVSWNRHGDGKQTLQNYTVDDLNEMYGNGWGFTDSTLKAEYQDGLDATRSGTPDYVKVTAEDAQKYDKEMRASDQFKAIEKADTTYQYLKDFEDAFKEQGSGINKFGADAGELQAKYQAAILNLKELFNLGVLNGPDQEILMKVLPDPSSYKGWLTGGGATVQAGIDSMKAQIGTLVQDRYSSLQNSYGQYGGQVGANTTVDSLYQNLKDLGTQQDDPLGLGVTSSSVDPLGLLDD